MCLEGCSTLPVQPLVQILDSEALFSIFGLRVGSLKFFPFLGEEILYT